MNGTLKNIVSYSLAVIIVCSAAFLVLYYWVGLDWGDALFWALFIPVAEFGGKGLIRLYRKFSAKAKR